MRAKAVTLAQKPGLWLGVMVVLVIVLNTLKLSFGSDFIILTLAGLAIFRHDGKLFIKDWLWPVVLFYVYEFARALADDVGRWLGTPFWDRQLIWIEHKLFFWMKDIPTVALQRWLRPDLAVLHWYDYILFFFYSMFFWYWLLAGFIIWRVKRTLFKPYMYGLVIFSLVDVLIYALVMTAPPWWAAQEKLIPHVERILWTAQYLPGQADTLKVVGTYGYNDFAALPSHHAAWPFFASLFMIKVFGKKALPLILVPLIIAFSTWYGAEHYVIDSIVGWIIAYIAYLLAIRWGKRHEKKAMSNEQ